MAEVTDFHSPTFVLFPANNNRTAWKPFGLPAILVVPHRRDPLGMPIQNSQIFNVRVYIEDVPRAAFVAGHDHVGMRFPDRELYAENLDSIELAERQIDLASVTITRNGTEVTLEGAKTGDIINYTTSTGIVDTITFLVGADYYDLSDVLIDVELLPSDNYNIVYESQYFTRVISKDGKSQFLCVDVNSTSLALLRFAIQHPGQVMDEFYRHTPPPYLTNSSKAKDTTVSLYRPFTDIFQDIMDEQNLLERINWVFEAPAEAIPYLSSLLGWDLPFFPLSLDQLRRAVLRRTVEFQNLKGSRRAIINIFRLFGFEVLITNLWWSSDGKRLIRPGEQLPAPYGNEEITIESKFQIDIGLADEKIDTFGEFTIPLLYRPQIEAGLDNFTALQDGGNITIDAYNVKEGSEAHSILQAISAEIHADPGGYGQTANCIVDNDGYINPTSIHDALSGAEIEGYSQVLISGKLGDATDDILAGIRPPLTKRGVQMNRETNTLRLTLNGYFDPSGDERIFLFITYSKLDVIVPSVLATLQSNRFDLQVLTNTLEEFADPITLEFAVEFLYRLKAFHSLLNVIRTRVDLTETYEVTDLCIGGDYDQRYNTDIGRLQVPPAIIPNIPGDITDCTKLDPDSLGYKESDIVLRLRKLANLPEEHDAWKILDNRDGEPRNDLLRLAVPMAASRDECKFTYRGQDRMVVQSRTELRTTEYGPSPNANQTAVGFASNVETSPSNLSQSGDFETTGSQLTTNSNSHQYGSFTKEYTGIREPHCELDGVNDYCYKGRVDDELLYRPTLVDKEYVRSYPCNLSLGSGVYWAYPTISRISNPGTGKPARGSKTQIIRFSGGAPAASAEHYLNDKHKQYLTAPYNSPLERKIDSLLGRLYRDYDKPIGETIHYSNRVQEHSVDQRSQLALQRFSLEVQKPTLHLPGCRFPRLNALKNDFEHPTWRAKPWDDMHSTYCGRKSVCGDQEPQFLNCSKTVDSDGNETLVFDDVPFTVLGNGLTPDIPSLGDHTLGTDASFDYADVIHKVYMRDADSKPAITFEQVCPYDINVDDGGLIQTTNPLFRSHNQCEETGVYHDYADGYPCLSGQQPYEGDDLGRSGLYDELFEALGLDSAFGTGLTYLFNLSSGIRDGVGVRLDCGNLLVDCEEATGGTGAAIIQSATITSTLINPTSIFINADGFYDWDCDHLSVTHRMASYESDGIHTVQLDGTIQSLLETIFSEDAPPVPPPTPDPTPLPPPVDLEQFRSHTVDALLMAELSKTITVNALLRKEISAIQTTDSFLISLTQQFVSHTSNALIKAQLSQPHTTDALRISEESATQSANASLRKELSKAHTADASLTAVVSKTQTTDAFTIPEVQQFQAHTTDALITAQEEPLLDLLAGAEAGYSLRQISSSYIGPAIKVRRSSDNSTQDINFINYELDIATLESFCGTGDGFVQTWYDQSGNGRHATQASLALQPQIVDNGTTITTYNGKPQISVLSSSQELVATGFSMLNTNLSMLYAIQASLTDAEFTSLQISLTTSNNSARTRFATTFHVGKMTVADGTGSNTLQNNNADDIYQSRWPHIGCFVREATGASTIYYNYRTVEQGTIVRTHAPYTVFKVRGECFHSEVVIYPTITTEERAILYDNMSAYWDWNGPASAEVQAISTLLPIRWKWQVDLYNWLAARTVDDYDLTGTPTSFTWDGTFINNDHLSNLWIDFPDDGPTNEYNPSDAEICRGAPEWFLLDDGAGHGIEGAGVVKMFYDRASAAQAKGTEAPATVILYNANMPNANASQGNPFYQNEALALRGLNQAMVNLMMSSLYQEQNVYFDATDFTGGAILPSAFTYYNLKDHLDADTQEAFEFGLGYAAWKLSVTPTHAVNTNIDMKALPCVAYTYLSTDDAVWKQYAVNAGKSLLFGDPNHTDPGTSTGVLKPGGYIVEGDSPETTYLGASMFYISEAYAITLGDPEWAYLEDVCVYTTRWKIYQVFPDPDGRIDGPSGYSGRTGDSVWYDQRSAPQRDLVLAATIDEGIAGRWNLAGSPTEIPASTAAMVAEIQDVLTEFNTDGFTPFAVGDFTPTNWFSMDRKWWPIDDSYYPPDGWYDTLRGYLTGNDPRLVLPFNKETDHNLSLGDQFWSYKANDGSTESKEFGWFIECLDDGGTYDGWYGGNIQVFWTRDTGIIIFSRHDKAGTDTAHNENTRDWPNIDIWAVMQVWGLDDSPTPTRFSTAVCNRLPNRTTAVDFNGVPPNVSITNPIGNLTGTSKGQQTGVEISSQLTITNYFEALADGILVTHTITSDEVDLVTALWATIPIFLRDAAQNTISDSTIAYWDGSTWQPLSTTLVTVDWIRIGRNFGAGDKYCFINFTAARVKLSSSVYVQAFQGQSRIRNILIDLHGNIGTAQLLPANQSITYTINVTDPGLVAQSPSVLIEQPDDDEIYPVGGLFGALASITWNSGGEDVAYLEYSTDNQGSWTTVGAMTINASLKYQYAGGTVPTGLTHIRVRAINGDAFETSVSRPVTSAATTRVFHDEFTAADSTAIDGSYTSWTTNTTGNAYQVVQGNCIVSGNKLKSLATLANGNIVGIDANKRDCIVKGRVNLGGSNSSGNKACGVAVAIQANHNFLSAGVIRPGSGTVGFRIRIEGSSTNITLDTAYAVLNNADYDVHLQLVGQTLIASFYDGGILVATIMHVGIESAFDGIERHGAIAININNTVDNLEILTW